MFAVKALELKMYKGSLLGGKANYAVITIIGFRKSVCSEDPKGWSIII